MKWQITEAITLDLKDTDSIKPDLEVVFQRNDVQNMKAKGEFLENSSVLTRKETRKAY